jgi:hypothetical protein
MLATPAPDEDEGCTGIPGRDESEGGQLPLKQATVKVRKVIPLPFPVTHLLDPQSPIVTDVVGVSVVNMLSAITDVVAAPDELQ